MSWLWSLLAQIALTFFERFKAVWDAEEKGRREEREKLRRDADEADRRADGVPAMTDEDIKRKLDTGEF